MGILGTNCTTIDHYLTIIGSLKVLGLKYVQYVQCPIIDDILTRKASGVPWVKLGVGHRGEVSIIDANGGYFTHTLSSPQVAQMVYWVTSTYRATGAHRYGRMYITIHLDKCHDRATQY